MHAQKCFTTYPVDYFQSSSNISIWGPGRLYFKVENQGLQQRRQSYVEPQHTGAGKEHRIFTKYVNIFFWFRRIGGHDAKRKDQLQSVRGFGREDSGDGSCGESALAICRLRA